MLFIETIRMSASCVVLSYTLSAVWVLRGKSFWGGPMCKSGTLALFVSKQECKESLIIQKWHTCSCVHSFTALPLVPWCWRYVFGPFPLECSSFPPECCWWLDLVCLCTWQHHPLIEYHRWNVLYFNLKVPVGELFFSPPFVPYPRKFSYCWFNLLRNVSVLDKS